jgi:hypothetical protein
MSQIISGLVVLIVGLLIVIFNERFIFILKSAFDTLYRASGLKLFKFYTDNTDSTYQRMTNLLIGVFFIVIGLNLLFKIF